jgi:23S rRNA-/tRNA-specific pseudouridylate synthase
VSAPSEPFWSALPLGRGVKLLTRDANGLVAFDKPAGVLSHPNSADDEPRALLTAHYSLESERYQWPAYAEAAVGRSVFARTSEGRPSGDGARAVSRLWLLNRLDSATSGVILAAASEELAREVRAQFKRKQIRKVYHALVFGAPAVAAQVWRNRLAVSKRAGQVRTSGAGHIPCESQMKLLRRRTAPPPLIALLQLEPHTGRSHQLRVQCALRRLPIVGDATYGDFARNREFAKATGLKRLFLHSLETSFDYEFGGRSFHFSARASLPEEFETVLGR